jgi:predicted nucleic acid-binding protein
MCKQVLRPLYLDASVLVKLVFDEDYSDRVRKYIFDPVCSWRICTSYCFAEALGVLKRKNQKKELSNKGYLVASRQLIRLVSQETLEIQEGEFYSLNAFAEAERMVTAYEIDFLDAFQIISVRESWSQLAKKSQPILVTADRDLAKAAEKERIEFWYCRETNRPKAPL